MATYAPSTRILENPRAERERLGLTRQKLAVAADCSYSWICRIEQGHATPRFSFALARVWDVLTDLAEAE
jgi:predicted transcriptional regulator